MGLGNSKRSKMGPLVGVDLTSVTKKTEEAPQPVETVVEQPQVQEPVKKQSKKKEESITQSITVNGRPKFELKAGQAEAKVNFHCPDELYTALSCEARKQKKTVKQFICEVLLEEMTKKYGFKFE